MPLWRTFVFTFLLIAIASAGAMWYFTGVLLVPFLSGSEYLAVVLQSGAIGTFLLIVIALAFFFLARATATPVRRLRRAVDAFSAKGVQIPFILPYFTPQEVRDLAHSFIGLMGNVEAAHNRDAEVSRVKSDFISTAAHQLRTPLTSVRWALEALEKDTLTEEQHLLVASAADKSRELIAIVGTLLDISAIESGKYKYKIEQMDMAGLVAEVVRDFAEYAEKRKISLLYTPGEPLAPARADRERVKWVLTNLVENAIRYTPEGGTVELRAKQRVDIIFITVRDTGIGIGPEDRGNIFERFYRAQNAISKESQGNGLGLYIARTIATDHGGELAFEANTEGPGTTFTLSLPVAGPRASA